jgi:hypothetical protein
MRQIKSSDFGQVRASATVAIASVALLAAGCGSSTPHRSGDPGPKSAADGAYKYSACMRNHGVTNFPDPKVSSHGDQTQIALVVPSTFAKAPAFKTAEQACQALMPGPPAGPTAAQEQAREHAMLAFARCVRSHGLTNFPDPTSQGQLTLEMIRAAGINLHAPDVLPAARACIGVTHGLITPNDVARAINGQESGG